jgi:hypothetical protein
MLDVLSWLLVLGAWGALNFELMRTVTIGYHLLDILIR